MLFRFFELVQYAQKYNCSKSWVDCKSWVENSYVFRTALKKLQLDVKIQFLCHSIEKSLNFHMLFKFLNLVKFDEIYKSSKSWVDDFGMKRVSFARWTNFVHPGDNPPRCVHEHPPSTIHSVDGRWWNFHQAREHAEWIVHPVDDGQWAIHSSFTSIPPSTLLVNTPILTREHSYSSSLFHFKSVHPVDGGRWTVDSS